MISPTLTLVGGSGASGGERGEGERGEKGERGRGGGREGREGREGGKGGRGGREEREVREGDRRRFRAFFHTHTWVHGFSSTTSEHMQGGLSIQKHVSESWERHGIKEEKNPSRTN